ncbi:MAG: PadR family transcriptional regulator [Rhodoglobus sp.]
MMSQIRQQWLHGFLDLCLLCLLEDRRDYGLGLMERLSASGFDEVPGGTLYPALLRLEKQGLVRVEWEASVSGPRRKYYELTSEGRGAAGERARSWAEFRTAIESIVGEVGASTETQTL